MRISLQKERAISSPASSPPACLALDIGGANLKAADGDGFARSQFFPLWRTPELLADALAELVAEAPACPCWVVTMTGELADCFRTKREGVTAIVEAVTGAALRQTRPPEVSIYLTDGSFATPDEARRRYLAAAASNWHALATLVARRFPEQSGVLVDIGSTTCDLVPFAGGAATAEGRTDLERLLAGELVYTGVVRSPICAVTPTLPWRGRACGTAQELFATTLDAYLLLGSLPEDPRDLGTADGRPATREFARERLARCLCADREMFDAADALAVAEAIRDAQLRLVAEAWGSVVGRSATSPSVVVVSGQGEFLARQMLQSLGWTGRVVSLGEQWGERASRVGPAYALARLARERG